MIYTKMKQYTEQLIYNVPGIVTSFEMSYNPNESNVVNFRSVLKRLNPDLTSSDKSIHVSNHHVRNLSPPRSSESISSSTLPKKRSSNYDIIEKLEKKWYTEPLLEMDLNGNHEGSFLSNGSVTSYSAENVPNENSIQLSKKVVNKFDAYDYDDNFIDDSECLVQMDAKLKSKKLRTKHDGFFVSSGQLEVEIAKCSFKKPQNEVTKEAVTNLEIGNGNSSSSSKSANKQNANKVTGDANDKLKHMTKKFVVAPQLTSESGVSPSNGNTGSSPTVKSPASMHIASDSPVVDPATLKSEPTVKWQPSEVEAEALEMFRSAVSHSGLKASKCYFPYELEGALDVLDSSAPIMHIEYIQAVCNAVGGLYTTGRLKLLVTRLQLERKAKLIKIKLDTNWDELKTQLKSRICLAPPPTVITQQQQQQPISSVSSESESCCVEAVAQHDVLDIPAENAGAVGDAVPSEGVPDSSVDPSPTAPPVAAEFKWICKWDTACRILLLDSLQLAQEWVRNFDTFNILLCCTDLCYRPTHFLLLVKVRLANAYRGKFTHADKKCRAEEEVRLELQSRSMYSHPHADLISFYSRFVRYVYSRNARS